MSQAYPEYLYQEEIYSFGRGVVVVLAAPWHKILDADKALLAKILGSVKISVDAVNIQSAEHVDAHFLEKHHPEKVLVFGPTVSENINPYEVASIHGVPIIKADALGQLDDVKKKSLWLALRQMFKV